MADDPTDTTDVQDARAQYTKLANRFRVTHKRDGYSFDYLSGYQVTCRLNDVLGYDGWQFTVQEHGFNSEADEVWVLGRLTVWSPTGREIVREQFGSQKHNRRKADGQILDAGFDLKGAATDALKKCASLIGVGLYLSAKNDEDTPPVRLIDAQALPARQVQGGPPAAQLAAPRPAAAPRANGARQAAKAPQRPAQAAPAPTCVKCGALIHGVTMSGKVLSAVEFAAEGERRFRGALCTEHFKAAAQTASAITTANATAKAHGQTNHDPAAEAAARATQPPADVTADAPLIVDGRLDKRVAAVRYGSKVAGLLGNGYRAPTTASKKTLYTNLTRTLQWKRESLFKMLGLDPATQHTEQWMQLAGCDTTAVLALATLKDADDSARIPTYAELAGGVS